MTTVEKIKAKKAAENANWKEEPKSKKQEKQIKQEVVRESKSTFKAPVKKNKPNVEANKETVKAERSSSDKSIEVVHKIEEPSEA